VTLVDDEQPEDSPSQLVRSAGEKFGRAQLACQSIDVTVIGARAGIEYVIALQDSGLTALRRALAYRGDPDGDTGTEQDLQNARLSPVDGGYLDEPAALPDDTADSQS
jgi:hypothetical protein